MPAGSELEIKLAITDNRLFETMAADPELLAMTSGSKPVSRSFEALYFDTAQFTLQNNGYSYRIRQEGDEWVATVKSDLSASGGLSEREEWNEQVAGPDPLRKPFAGTNIGDRLALMIGSEKLQLLFSTRFTRITFQLRTAGGTCVELALDRGTIWSGASGIPISELELELLEGSAGELLKLAAWFASRWHLLPELKSKFARGVELLQHSNPDRQIPSLQTSVRQLSTPDPLPLINNQIKSLFLAQSTVAATVTPDNIRELRVQFRRLRSVLKFFQPCYPKDSLTVHLDQLRQWSQLLGQVRDLDLLTGSWMKFAEKFQTVLSPTGQWLAQIAERRDFLADHVLYRIRQGILTQNLLELQGFLYQAQDQEETGCGETRADLFLQKTLMQAAKELRDDLKEPPGIQNIKALHRLRIRIKRLRYLQDSLNVIPHYRDDDFIAGLKKLQGQLGKIHDAYQIKSLLDSFEAGNEADRFRLEKELFLCWRTRDLMEYFAELPKLLESCRQLTKSRLHALAALRSSRGTKAGQNAGAHEPGH